MAQQADAVIGCAALLVPVLGGKRGGLMADTCPLLRGVSPCLHNANFVLSSYGFRSKFLSLSHSQQDPGGKKAPDPGSATLHPYKRSPPNQSVTKVLGDLT
jgi:hypothetical protein